MALLTVQPLAMLAVTDTYAAVSASDTFAASTGQSYVLRYVNGGTATTAACYVKNQQLVVPTNAVPVIPATPAVTALDGLIIATTFPATTSRMVLINPVDNYLSGGLVTLLHGGTLTTLTVGVFGPC